jgi:hypothetical protein
MSRINWRPFADKAFEFRAEVVLRVLRQDGRSCALSDVAKELRKFGDMEQAYRSLTNIFLRHSPDKNVKRPTVQSAGESSSSRKGIPASSEPAAPHLTWLARLMNWVRTLRRR